MEQSLPNPATEFKSPEAGKAPGPPLPLRSAELARFRLFATFAPFVLLLVLWIWVFSAAGAFQGGPAGKDFEADFAMFLGAAKVMQAGGNPYDPPTLYRTEASMLKAQHLGILTNREIVRVGNPPLFFWALRPLVGLPFQWLGFAWMVLLYLASALGFLALIRHFGWRKWVLPLAFFLLMPQVVLGPFYGNVVDLLFAGLAFSIALARRYPFIAGTFLLVAWLKPPVALPLALLILMFQAPERSKMLAGFVSGSLFSLVLTLGLTGPHSLLDWSQGLVGYSTHIHMSPDITSLSGLYARSAAQTVRLILGLFMITVALIFTILVWRRRRALPDVSSHPSAFLPIAWLWVAWFLAAPYAHFFDEILLAVPFVALLGRDAVWSMRREPVLALYAAFGSLLVLSAAPFGIQLLWIPLIVILLCLFIAGRSPRYAVSGIT